MPSIGDWQIGSKVTEISRTGSRYVGVIIVCLICVIIMGMTGFSNSTVIMVFMATLGVSYYLYKKFHSSYDDFIKFVSTDLSISDVVNTTL
jgi:uncharacterized membrane protein